VPFATLQVVPQAPQFVALVRTSISHPSTPVAGFASQLAKFVGQLVTPQTPLLQLGTFPPVGGQTVPQALQLLTSVLVLISHPFASEPSQFANPDVQVIEQVPPLQLGAPLVELHGCPQPPQ
jgi:hypothetical protein